MASNPLLALADVVDIDWINLIPVSPVTLVPQIDEQCLSAPPPSSSPASMFSPNNDEEMKDINIGMQATMHVSELSDRRMNENKCFNEAEPKTSAETKSLSGSGRRKQNLKDQTLKSAAPKKPIPLWQQDADSVEPAKRKRVLKAKQCKLHRLGEKKKINQLMEQHKKDATTIEMLQRENQEHIKTINQLRYKLEQAEYFNRGMELFDISSSLME